jgi:hypothetical protein
MKKEKEKKERRKRKEDGQEESFCTKGRKREGKRRIK